jgi:hypothetical protein
VVTVVTPVSVPVVTAVPVVMRVVLPVSELVVTAVTAEPAAPMEMTDPMALSLDETVPSFGKSYCLV